MCFEGPSKGDSEMDNSIGIKKDKFDKLNNSK